MLQYVILKITYCNKFQWQLFFGIPEQASTVFAGKLGESNKIPQTEHQTKAVVSNV